MLSRKSPKRTLLYRLGFGLFLAGFAGLAIVLLVVFTSSDTSPTLPPRDAITTIRCQVTYEGGSDSTVELTDPSAIDRIYDSLVKELESGSIDPEIGGYDCVEPYELILYGDSRRSVRYVGIDYGYMDFDASIISYMRPKNYLRCPGLEESLFSHCRPKATRVNWRRLAIIC